MHTVGVQCIYAHKNIDTLYILRYNNYLIRRNIVLSLFRQISNNIWQLMSVYLYMYHVCMKNARLMYQLLSSDQHMDTIRTQILNIPY